MTSPFLEGTQIQYAWDSTSLGWLKECPRKYYYAMIVGWRPKAETVNIKFGGLYHSGLEHYDKLRAAGSDHETSLNETVKYLLIKTWEPAQGPTDEHPEGTPAQPWLSDHNSKTRETLIRSVVWYLEQFKDDPAKTVILANGKPAVELSFKLELDWPADGTLGGQPYMLCGHLDRVVEFSSGVYVMDRKTTSYTLAPSYFEQFDPDNQMSLYTLASKVIYKTPVKGVIVDAAQVAVGFTRFSRGFTYRTDSQIDEWLDDTKYWLGHQADLARRNIWPMNDKSCHKYGGCHFRKICSKSPEVRDVFLHSDFIKQPWNPLVPR